MNAKTYELGHLDASRGWVRCSDYASEGEALEAAKAWAAARHDGSGATVFGLSIDPDSEYYEQTVEVRDDGTVRTLDCFSPEAIELKRARGWY